MKLLEPVVQLIGRMSFRNKLRGTALVFGIPLLAVTSLLLMAINERVQGLEQERAALHVQLPALTLLSNLYQLSAVAEGMQEGDESLKELLPLRQTSSLHALNDLRQAAERNGLQLQAQVVDGKWLGHWDEMAKRISEADAQGLGDLSSAVRSELDAANGKYGLLSDGDVAGSRLLDVMTSHLPGLVEAGGRATGIGTVVLIKQSVRGSRRSDLTLLRGNLDALVMWSIDNLRKVGGEHPNVAATLDAASGHLNTAFSSLQEAITIKMLDTTDYGMTPAAYLAISEKALGETLLSAGMLAEAADIMLLERLTVLQVQRNLVIGAIALALLCVLAGFIAAYISIMRGINGLSDAVGTMAAGNLGARVEVSSSDELGEVGERFNQMAENLAQRTAELHEKTNDINVMLQNLPQGILTIVGDGKVHPEYSAYLESIFEASGLGGCSALELLFGGTAIGVDARSQLEASIAACIGEDAMNFAFNSHLLPLEAVKSMPDGRQKILEMTWAPICDEADVVEKLMVCVRDVTELRQLLAESEHQKLELEMIGQILKVNQEKFHEFVEGSKSFIAENQALLGSAIAGSSDLVTQLFRNMHTIKGNARTYGLSHLTNVVHQAEQAYDELRKSPDALFDRAALLAQLQDVTTCLDEYSVLNEVKLGRKGPGRRGSAEKYLMVNREQMEQMLAELDAYNLQACTQETLAAALAQVKSDLRLLGTESIRNILSGVFESMPALAKELKKEVPTLVVADNGVAIRNQASDLTRNVFMHLYRNSMDHGIELPEERLANGKPAAGSIRLAVELSSEKLLMRLSDDGRGLALGHIREKGLAKGLINEAQAQDDAAVANLIFAAGFSTAASVTEVSGRGVGMDAVQDFIKREGGSIRLQLTDDAAGANFRKFETLITLPARLAVNADSAGKMQQREARDVPAGHPEAFGIALPVHGLALNTGAV